MHCDRTQMVADVARLHAEGAEKAKRAATEAADAITEIRAKEEQALVRLMRSLHLLPCHVCVRVVVVAGGAARAGLTWLMLAAALGY